MPQLTLTRRRLLETALATDRLVLRGLPAASR